MLPTLKEGGQADAGNWVRCDSAYSEDCRDFPRASTEGRVQRVAVGNRPVALEETIALHPAEPVEVPPDSSMGFGGAADGGDGDG